jgi:AraC-like DNA-binding protein
MQGLKFAHNGSFLQENLVWDTLFISASTNYKIYILPEQRSRCLGISFSKKWLINNVFGDSDEFDELRERFNTTAQFSLVESMSVSEKKIIEELVENSWERPLGSFYIKSSVLNIVCDFFYKLKEKEDPNLAPASSIASLTKIEKYLSGQILSSLPNLKELSGKFNMSESTLKRHFKKRYKTTMSNYFNKKKMEYAQQLMSRENKNIKETASMLGYKNANNFISVYKKYIKY